MIWSALLLSITLFAYAHGWENSKEQLNLNIHNKAAKEYS
jgi:hypothetical protein